MLIPPRLKAPLLFQEGKFRLISSPPKLGGVRGGLNQGHTTNFSDDPKKPLSEMLTHCRGFLVFVV